MASDTNTKSDETGGSKDLLVAALLGLLAGIGSLVEAYMDGGVTLFEAADRAGYIMAVAYISAIIFGPNTINPSKTEQQEVEEKAKKTARAKRREQKLEHMRKSMNKRIQRKKRNG